MGINVAGTNAIGDYLAGQIQNTRILMGESPSASPTPVVSPGAPAPAGSSNSDRLQAQVADAQLANTRTLFGVAQPATGSAGPESLPPVAGQTPHQIEMVAIQSSLIAQQFENISTLFSSLGVGTNVNALG